MAVYGTGVVEGVVVEGAALPVELFAALVHLLLKLPLLLLQLGEPGVGHVGHVLSCRLLVVEVVAQGGVGHEAAPLGGHIIIYGLTLLSLACGEHLHACGLEVGVKLVVDLLRGVGHEA